MTCLAAFEAAARLGSFTKAAAEMNLSQAAISRQIKVLEADLGERLFARHRHDVSLTQMGRQFASQVAPALQSIADAARAARQEQALSLSIFAEMSLAAYWLTPRLSSFMAAHPDIALNVVTSNRTMAEEPGAFDVALQYGGGARNLISHQISNDLIFPVAAPEFAQRSLMDLPLLHLIQPGRGWLDWPTFCEATGQPSPPPPHMTFNTYSSLLDAAMAGAGAALGWGLMVEGAIRAGKLVRIGAAHAPSPQALTAHIPERPSSHAPTRAFLRWLRQQVE